MSDTPSPSLVSRRRTKTSEPWTFDARDREAQPLRIRNHQRPRTPDHHPNLDGLGHVFGPELRCRCGLSYQVVQEKPAPCEGD